MTIYSKKLAEGYSKHRDSYVATDAEVSRILKTIGVKGKHVLDFGCGDGRYTIMLSKLGAEEVIGIDISSAMIKLAQARMEYNAPYNVCFIEADGMALPFADHSFDIVFANFVFQHFVDTAPALTEIYRVLKPQSSLVSTFGAFTIAPSASHLINTCIPVRLGHGKNSVLVHDLVKPVQEIHDTLDTIGFKIGTYTSVPNPDALIDVSYQHKNKVEMTTIICIAKKS